MVEADGSQGKPLAVETGFWRPLPDNGVEVLLTHSTGILEMYLGKVEVGAIQDARITRAKAELRTDVVVRSDSAKPYQTGHRLYGLAEGDLLWTFDMAAMGEGLSNHVAARLSPAGG